MGGEVMARRRTKSGVRFARVPSGSETCPFCIMLASRGFVYWSAESAGESNHYHPHCDCVVVPGWDGLEVEGYNPSKLYDRYVEMLHDGTLDYSKLVKGRGTSHVLGWSSEQFESIGDFQRFVEAAHTIEELQERCAIAEAEWGKSVLSDKYYGLLRETVQRKKSELMVGVSKQGADQLSISAKSFGGIVDAAGKSNVEDMVSTMKEVGDKRAVRFFESHGNKIRIEDIKGDHAYFDPRDNVVRMNVRLAVDGDDYHLPYQNIAHEGAHMIDNSLGGGVNLSVTYGNGALAKSIAKDMSDVRSKYLKDRIDRSYLEQNGLLPKARSVMRNAKSDDGYAFDDWERYESGLMPDEEVYEKYLGRYIDKSISSGDFDSELVRVIREEYGTLPTFDTACLSDILEGQTGVSYPLDGGHGASYWFDRDKIPIEFFAEYVDSLAFNPESSKMIRAFFPNASKVVEEIIDGLS